jgi:hypothetical protein
VAVHLDAVTARRRWSIVDLLFSRQDTVIGVRADFVHAAVGRPTRMKMSSRDGDQWHLSR